MKTKKQKAKNDDNNKNQNNNKEMTNQYYFTYIPTPTLTYYMVSNTSPNLK